MFLSVWPLLADQETEYSIYQTSQKITVDGKLEEWKDIQKVQVDLQVDGKEVGPTTDITVSAMFTFNRKFFYAALLVRDDIFEFPNRSWRYGDGLILTFFEPHERGASDRFYSYGFSMEDKDPRKYLVNRDGEYFPPGSLDDVDVAIKTNISERTIIYELAIPFTHLEPFKPFIHKLWGINLTYADSDRGDRRILQLFPDKDYDTERTQLRKGAIFQFVPHTPEKPEVQATMNASHYYHDAEKDLTFAIHTPTPGEWTLIYNLSSQSKSFTAREKRSVQAGMNIIKFTLEDEDYASGLYDLSVGAVDDTGRLRFTQDNTFFIFNRDELAEYEAKLGELKEHEEYSQNDTYVHSLPTAEIRIQWVKEFMQDAPPFADRNTLHQYYVDLEFLVEELEEGKPALFLPGRVGRLAHRSQIDGSLQPYSLYVPDYAREKQFAGARGGKGDISKRDKEAGEKEEPEKEKKESEELFRGERLGLFVTLHGSGVDEKRYILNVAQTHLNYRFRHRIDRMLVLAPQARGLSDYYLGDSGRDVLECIEHVKKLYNIDPRRIVLDGFSMGGYGAWRLGLLYPDIFKAVIVRSGAVEPPPPLAGESVLELLEEDRRNHFFIVHGDSDQAVSVEGARQAVRKMSELGMEFRYEEVEGAAHGGYDEWDEIFKWLRDLLPPAAQRQTLPLKDKRD
jgi:predicted esterase